MRQVISFWTPFLMTGLLCVMLYWNKDASWSAFVCFLPMSFFFIGAAFMEMHGNIRKLEERIKTLEAGKA